MTRPVQELAAFGFFVAILLFILTGVELARLKDDHERLECYIGQQFAVADSIMVHFDGNLDLAWPYIARKAASADQILTVWMERPPWMYDFRVHARGINTLFAYCEHLSARVDSLAALHESGRVTVTPYIEREPVHEPDQ